jgi:GT2 family glycosyltransferase
MTKKIAVIIPVHNSLEFTKACLSLLLPLTKEASSAQWQFDIIVVDDGSTDGTSEWILKNHSEVRLVKGDGQLWWSGGINKGMQYALHILNVDYILWWNNDIYPADVYFTNLTSLLENSSNSTVLGSKVLKAEEPNKIWAFGGLFHQRWGHSFLYGSNEVDGERFSRPKEVDWLPGMGTVLPREIILKTGEVNNEEFPQYHGDIDYTYRAKLAGYKIVVEPSLQIWNHTRHSSRSHEGKLSRLIPTLSDIKSLNHFRTEWLVYRKHAKTPLVYLVVVKKYMTYFGGFLKEWFFGR